MKSILIHPTYFPSISNYVLMNSYRDNIVFENEDNYQKQTYRNRAHIYSSYGLQKLIVPIKHSKNSQRQKYREIRIDNSVLWQKNHQKSLEIAYRSSAFYEFFEEKIDTICSKKFDFLLDLNYESVRLINDCLGLKISFSKTTQYMTTPNDNKDFRHLSNAKSGVTFGFSKYYQLFADRWGFIENMSCLDLMFNEGLATLEYLDQNLKYIDKCRC